MVGLEAEQPLWLADENGSVRRFTNGGADARRKAFLFAEFPEAFAFIAKDAVFGSNPDEADSVLKEAFRRQVRQSLIQAKELKRILLPPRGRAGEHPQRAQRKEVRGGRRLGLRSRQLQMNSSV